MAQKKKPASAPPRLALIVLGMHRSGTSALAGVLAKMGADLPQDLMPANEFNPDGYFESLRAYELNDALLGSAGSSWDDWHAVNADWYGSPRKQEYALRAQGMLEQEFGASGFFVLKDPRICRLVPFWSEVMAEAGIEPRFVCTHRNPVEVAASLTRRNGWSESRGLLLWLRHVLDAETDSRGHRRAFVSYDGLLSDWRGTIGRIGLDLALRWPIQPETAAPGIEDFLSDSRRTFRAAEMDGPTQGTVSGWIGEVQSIMDRWVQDGEAQSDHRRLDDIRVALRETDATLSLLMQETQHESEQARRLQSKLEQAHAKISELDAAMRTAREDAASHAANHATEQRARANAQIRINELDEALEAAREGTGKLQTNIASERRARTEAETRIAELDMVLKAAREEAQARSAVEDKHYKALAESYDVLEARHDALGKTLEQANHERDQLRSQLEQSRTEAQDLHDQTLSDAAKIANLEFRLRALDAEHMALRRKSDREARQLAAMKQQLSMRFSREIEQRLNGNSAQGEDQEQQAMLSEWSAERDHIEQGRLAAEARIAELDTALKTARTQADQLLNSKSWRVTAPLRYMREKIRGK